MEFKDIITNTLEGNGFLNHIRAQLRGEIYESISTDKYLLEECQKLSEFDLITAQVLKDFLEKSHAEHTLKTFTKESNLKIDKKPLEDTLKKVGLACSSENSLIYEIIKLFKQKHSI